MIKCIIHESESTCLVNHLNISDESHGSTELKRTMQRTNLIITTIYGNITMNAEWEECGMDIEKKRT